VAEALRLVMAMACMGISEERKCKTNVIRGQKRGKQEIAQSRSSTYRAARLRDFPDLAKAKSRTINRAFLQPGPIVQPWLQAQPMR
jgi:hypothetical protein